MVDVNTGAATFVGSHNLPDVFSISVDPSNGFLYALQANSYFGLHRLNKATGAASLIGDPGVAFGGADFANGAILANESFSGNFYAVDPTTAMSRLVGTMPFSPNDSGMAYDPDTDLIYIVDHGGALLEVDPARNFAVTTLVTGLGTVNGAAIVPDGAPNTGRMELSIQGQCPGQETLTVRNATPNGRVAIATSSTAGGFMIPGGGCSGVYLPLNTPRLATTLTANANGEVTVTPNFAGPQCNLNIVAVDLASCQVTNIANP